jgi:glycosyltransferase involved in cell wall biosynthesis
VFDSSEPKNRLECPFPIRYQGRMQDDISLRVLYAAADVVVAPSKQENLSNTIMEAMACGTRLLDLISGAMAI